MSEEWTKETYYKLFNAIIQYTMHSAGGDGDGVIRVREPKNFQRVCDLFKEYLIDSNIKPYHEPHYDEGMNNFYVDWLNGDQDNYLITTDLNNNEGDINVLIWGC